MEETSCDRRSFNGIRSANYGPSDGSFRFEMAAAEADDTAPVQKPIAEAIEETGEVALHVQFEFNSDKLDPSAETTLLGLRDTLDNAPKLRLMLVGHTDAVGSASAIRICRFGGRSR